MTTVRGYYDGSQIVMNEKMNLNVGQEVIVTILNMPAKEHKSEIDLSKYMGRGEKMFHTDAQDYVKELRTNDRL